MAKTRKAVLIEVSPLDPWTEERVTLRLCDADDAALTDLDGSTWWPGVARAPTLNREAFNGSFTAGVAPPQAVVALHYSSLVKAYADAPVLRFAGAPLKVYVGPLGGAWTEFSALFNGFVTEHSFQQSVLQLTSQVDGEPFQANVLNLTYAGSGGAEGDLSLKDKVKPAVFGYAMNVEPVLIDTVNNVFQVHGYGPIEDVVAVYERAASFGASVGDFPSYAALVAAGIGEGTWGTCKAEGMFRLGAPPFGLITADVKGDNTGGWHRSTADVIKRVCDIAEVAAPENLVPDDQFASSGNWNFAPNATQVARNNGAGFGYGNADHLLDWIVPLAGTDASVEINTYPNRSAVEPGVTYYGSVWVQKNPPVPPGVEIFIGAHFFDAGGAQIGGAATSLTSDDLVGGDPPKRFSFIAASPTGAATATFWMYIPPIANGHVGTIRFELPVLSPSPLDLDSFDAFDEAVPYPIGVYISSPETTIDVIQRLALPCNAQATLSWLGELQITRFGGLADPTFTLDAQGRQLPPVLDNAELSVSPPYWRMEMTADRCWRVQTPDEIASA